MRAVNVPRKAGFDTPSYVDKATAGLFLMSGYTFVVRYVRTDKCVNDRPDASPGAWLISLSHQELAGLLETGLLVSPVQIGTARNGHKAGAQYGAQLGEAAAWNCRALGIPSGVTVWLQAEWEGTIPTVAKQTAHYTAQAEQLVGAGYEAGLYVSSGCSLSPEQLYALPHITHYWQSSAVVPDVAVRHYCLTQGFQCGGRVAGRPAGPRVHGLVIDQLLARLDSRGDRFRVVGP